MDLLKNPLETLNSMTTLQDLVDHLHYMIHHEQEFVKAAYHRLLKLGDSSFQSKSSERSYKPVESMPNEEIIKTKEDNIAFLKEYLRVV